jgi:hypothetical protein
VTQALHYASAPDAPRFSPWRLFLWAVYYVCWPLGLVLPGWFGMLFFVRAVLHNTALSPQANHVCLFASVAAGLALAYALRGRRWPHLAPVLLGAAMVALAVALIVFNQKSFGAQGGGYLAVLILIALVNGVILCTAGVAGFLLNGRRR